VEPEEELLEGALLAGEDRDDVVHRLPIGGRGAAVSRPASSVAVMT